MMCLIINFNSDLTVKKLLLLTGDLIELITIVMTYYIIILLFVSGRTGATHRRRASCSWICALRRGRSQFLRRIISESERQSCHHRYILAL